MAVRPNSRSLSVAQGKGLDAESARVSAFMEAAEMAHAEHAHAVRVETYARMQARERVPHPGLLPKDRRRSFNRHREIAWVAGTSIRSSETVWVPHDLVHLDYRHRSQDATSGFIITSNGLASGNHRLEASCAGLYEVVERDATALWRVYGSGERARRRLRLSSVTDKDCQSLLQRLEGSEMSVAIWDVTTDIGVPSFLCRIREALGNKRSQLGAFWGSGCHLARGIALSRALTEAAQSRLTYIAGSRDDLRARDYVEDPQNPILDFAVDIDEQRAENRRFEDVPDFCSDSFEMDLQQILSHLEAAGITEILTVDLTRSSIGIPVVRVIVPGLEGMNDFCTCRPGPRVRAMLKVGTAA